MPSESRLKGKDGRSPDLVRTRDEEWRKRADSVIPGGMYGHVRLETLPDGYPQFFERSSGARVWDLDGQEYVDLMCAWGPMILGYGNQEVDAAFAKQLAIRDISDGPPTVMVELAELFVDLVAHADWAIFGKNGTDVTTTALTVARAATGKKIILKATGAYHGSIPWCTPSTAGVTPEDRVNFIEFEYNDIESLAAAAELAGDDLAGVIVTPHRHNVHSDQILALPEFARSVRSICDASGAVLILDDVRSGFRVDLRGSWEPLGVRPDLTAFSKCIANGYPLAALTGVDSLRDSMNSIYVTGSFWYGAASLAAGISCLNILRSIDATSIMAKLGDRLMSGLREQAASHDIPAVVSGPPALPLLRIDDDGPFNLGEQWCAEVLRRGVFLHPWHNWFLSAAHTDSDIDRVLEATDGAFAYVARLI